MNKRLNKLIGELGLDREMQNMTAVNAEDIKNRVNEELGIMLPKKKPVKYQAFKSMKIIAAAAAVILVVGLFNIQVVIAFINKLLFFTPGVGFTETKIIYEGIDAPINIETEYGIITLKFVNKITREGKTDLCLYFYSYDIPAAKMEEYPIYINISSDGENIVSNEQLISGTGYWGSGGANFITYTYVHENFSDMNEFDLTVLGVETHISLSYQPDNYVLSKKNNGIVLAVNKFNGVTDMISLGVWDNSDNAKNYKISGYLHVLSQIYDEAGEEIQMTSGHTNFAYPLNYTIQDLYKNEKDIKAIKSDMIRMTYVRTEPMAIEIPVPKDGETVKTNIELPIGSHTLKITEIKREGDTIYYKDNTGESLQDDGYEQVLAKAVANCESYIMNISFDSYIFNDIIDPEFDFSAQPAMANGKIQNFDETAETLTFYFFHATIIQYGDFNITFD